MRPENTGSVTDAGAFVERLVRVMQAGLLRLAA
jgi:hypothetical protein